MLHCLYAKYIFSFDFGVKYDLDKISWDSPLINDSLKWWNCSKMCQPSNTSTLRWAFHRFTFNLIVSKLVNLLKRSTRHDYNEENSWPLRPGKCQMRENVIMKSIFSYFHHNWGWSHATIMSWSSPLLFTLHPPNANQPLSISVLWQNPSASNNYGPSVSSNYSNTLAAITAVPKQNQHLS